MLTDDYNKHGHFHHYPFHVHETDDQLPIISQVGRGIKGDSFFVRILEDSAYNTILQGLSKDESTGAWSEEWVSENINGGELMYQYNLRPYTDPQTFTITFRLKRPNRPEWAWTTPAIPYIWDADKDGQGDVNDVVGVGVASLFVKKTTGGAWVVSDMPTSYTIAEAANRQEKLLYPTGWTRDQLNAPKPGDPYTVNLTYGIGGDIDVPNIDDLAKLLGITVQNIRNIIAGQSGQFNGSDNVRDYVDDLKSHIHADMGFGNDLISDGNNLKRNGRQITPATIKAYIDDVASSIFNSIYPVGSVYMTMNGGFDPNSVFGGTWVRIENGKYLRSYSTGDTSGGGIDSFELNENNTPLPSHEHYIGMSTVYRQGVIEQAGSASQNAGPDADSLIFKGRLLVSEGVPEPSDPSQWREQEAPNGATVEKIRDTGTPGDDHLNLDNIAKTGGSHINDDKNTRRTTIPITPKYFDVVVWKRTA